MIAIIDYGAGNLFSVKNALNYLGLENKITKDPDEIQKADGCILPGVGAFPDAMKMLAETQLIPVIQQEAKKKPLLGICLGMQMLFETGYEFQECEGLGLIPGTVRLIKDVPGFKIPHIGWNNLRFLSSNPLTSGLQDGDSVYFVHSYMAETEKTYITAVCDYSEPITAFVRSGMVYGTQFHPEKSGQIGLRILKNFGELTQSKTGGRESI